MHVCDFGHTSIWVSAEFVLPKSEHAHARSSQRFIVRQIAILVALDFQSPKRTVRPRHMSAAATPMPETAIGKDSEMLLREKEVRSANDFIGVHNPATDEAVSLTTILAVVYSGSSICPGSTKSMSLDPLVELVHSLQQDEWSKRNDEAFRALFGSPDGRYPKAAEKSVTLRAPEMSQDSGVPFAAYIHPSNPTKGAYGGFSFVIFPAAEVPCLVGLVVGTQGLAPDEAILGRPGHARKAQAICAWLNKEFGKGQQIAWAKQDPTRLDVDIPDDLQRRWSDYKAVFDRYGKVMYSIFKPSSDS